MSVWDDEEPLVPLRVTEATVAAYQWDQWQAASAAAVERAERRAAVAAIVGAVAVAAAGLLLLPGDARFSVAVYTPFAGWAAWAWTRRSTDAWGLDPVLDAVRSTVVPALVRDISTEGLESLLQHGGTLLTDQSTVLVAQRRDAAVVLVATEWDPRDLPPAVGVTDGGGP